MAMRYGVSTKLPAEKVIEKAIDFFGNLGLELTQRSDDGLCLEGGGGHVTLSLCPDGTGTEVEIETREWDRKVKEFIQRIGG
ncbi:MAG: hypothetical protein ACLFUV_03730 [Methanomassiliicoccales archaeon]